MKNIHILPTEDKLFKLSEYDEPNVDYAQNQNIYITSDEKIKKEDWFLDDTYKQPMKYFGEGSLLISSKKIILTTDQDLIKDGIQAIDDEFLEWFVKNPSCEFVDINLVEDLYGVIVKEENLTNREPAFFSYKIKIQ